VLPVDLPEIIGGRYRPRSVLGSGATGTVYAVEHAVTGDVLALKLMRAHLGASEEAIARFKREARAASSIRSQHVVRIFDADVAPELGGAPYLVMDLLEGSDLEQIANGKPVAPEDVVEWLRQVARPLDKAHRLGITHRDLKPENLFLTRLDDGTAIIKILDFGIAKIAAESTGTTQTGQIFGTPQYMAPEQARGDHANVGPATDLFALGLIAYGLLTGASYRTGTNLAEMLHEILNQPMRAPSERGSTFGPEFDGWFLRACDSNPAARFSSAQEQIEALALALALPIESELPVPSSVPPPASPNGRTTPVAGFHGVASSQSGLEVRRSRPAAPEADVVISAKGVVMPTLPTSEGPRGGGGPKRRAWIIALVAVSLLVVVPLVAFAWSAGKARASAMAARTSACPVDSAVASVAVAAPVPSPPSGPVVPAVVADSPDAPAKPTTVASRPSQSSRSSTNRPAMARALATRRTATDDDPLSDQQ
jgi:serine/threonine protein kinase